MGPGPALNHRGQGVSPVAVRTLGSRYGCGLGGARTQGVHSVPGFNPRDVSSTMQL